MVKTSTLLNSGL